jgi:hypothetical protein
LQSGQRRAGSPSHRDEPIQPSDEKQEPEAGKDPRVASGLLPADREELLESFPLHGLKRRRRPNIERFVPRRFLRCGRRAGAPSLFVQHAAGIRDRSPLFRLSPRRVILRPSTCAVSSLQSFGMPSIVRLCRLAFAKWSSACPSSQFRQRRDCFAAKGPTILRRCAAKGAMLPSFRHMGRLLA